jgi:(p)ppGpp synthase/HD superfamily hydrolase
VYPQTNLQLYAQLRAAAWPVADLRRVRDAHALAKLLFSARYRGSGKPFLAHLVGTAGILAAHGADVGTVCAGLVHAAYLQGDFGLRGRRGAAARRRVARAIGAEAEEIVWRYTTSSWEAPGADPRVLLVRLANELEETLDLNLLYEGPRKRDVARRTLSAAIAAAERAGHARLAAELREGADLLATARVPAELVEPADWSYTEAPLSYRRRPLCRIVAAARAVMGRIGKRSVPRGD